jgi:hypothetical protein
MPLTTTGALSPCLLALLLQLPALARAQGGPPFLTNDPGTPGDANWEINLGSMQSLARGGSAYQVPQLDINLGLGDRIQLTYEIPYALQDSAGQALHGGWGNAFSGVKWRFLDQGEQGWQLSTFPQIETGVSAHAQLTGIGIPDRAILCRWRSRERSARSSSMWKPATTFLRMDRRSASSVLSPAGQSPGGWSSTPKSTMTAPMAPCRMSPRFDLGGRYQLLPGVIALFMGGRSLNGFADGQPEFFGYLGVQVLLKHYGRTLNNLQR